MKDLITEASGQLGKALLLGINNIHWQLEIKRICNIIRETRNI